jgi:hypothetical protein
MEQSVSLLSGYLCNILNLFFSLAEYERGALPGSRNSLFTIDEAYSNTRDELTREIHNILHSLFKKQLRLHSDSIKEDASEKMSKMSFLDATTRNTAEDIRNKAAESFKSDAKSWIPKGCDWDTEQEAWQMLLELDQIRKEKQSAIIVCLFLFLIDIMLTGFSRQGRLSRRVSSPSLQQCYRGEELAR